ncbi:MAG TPA: ATP-grasp domain-containing protein [Steroidobacteraceae bacterium]|nr:ATP-grasp domain-containing protein [Steroidobacteraceae bacterium]
MTLNSFAPRDALIAALRKVRPDLIVPCDDGTVFLLHDIHAAHPDLRDLIERSLGPPAAFGVLQSRDRLQRVAAELGIRVPRSLGVESAAQAARCLTDLSPTAVVKLDGTYGGEGVSVVHSKEEAAAAFSHAQSATSALVAVKRMLINRDPYAVWTWRRRARARITMQQYIVGAPANIMVACWQGQILAQVSVEALSCQGATGAANIVRRIARPEFEAAARALAAHLKLSGFFGLDFMIERDTDFAYLIEMNPRCTQLGHLQFADQKSLASALCERISAQPTVPAALTVREAVVAFFPQAWRWKPAGPEWSSAFHDIPWGEEALIKALLGEPWPDRLWPARLYHWFRPPLQAPAADFRAAPMNLADRSTDQPLAGESLRL